MNQKNAHQITTTKSTIPITTTTYIIIIQTIKSILKTNIKQKTTITTKSHSKTNIKTKTH